MSQQVPTPAADVPTGPMSKVFVGNLAFRTTDQDLQTLFKECGEIKAGVIITRGRRSLGYGFIEFVRPEDAAASVDVMNKKEFLGRPLKVELAKDPSERPDRLERTDRDEPEPDQPPRQRRVATPKVPVVDPATGDVVQPKKRTRAPKKAPAEGQVTQTTQTTQVSQNPGDAAADPEGAKKKKRARARKPRKNAENANETVTDTPAANPAANVDVKVKRAPAPQVKKEKIDSKTTLFVANLPFSYDDAALFGIFDGLKPKSAHVVKTYNNRSRGYGFVEFENEADQLAALQAKNGTLLTPPVGEPRAIAISISSSNVSSPELEAQAVPQ